MMLGASAAWAKTYTVKYVGLPSGTTGGFTINNTDFKTGETYVSGLLSYNVYNYITSTDNSSKLTITAYYNSLFGESNTLKDSYCISITSDNYSDYITPNTVDGYELSSVSVNESSLVITITYAKSKLITWSDGVFTYSNYHIQSTSNKGYMDDKFDYYPGQPEVAISLKLGEPRSVTDDIAYQLYYITDTKGVDSDGVPTGSGNWYKKGSDGYLTSVNSSYPVNGSGVTLRPSYYNDYKVTATDDDGDGEATYVLQSSMYTYDGETTDGSYIS